MKKRKIEFKKKLAIFSVILIVIVTNASFILAFMGLVVPEQMTNTIIGTAFGYLVAYATTSTVEKNSRNKYGIDIDGNPIAKAVTEIGDNLGG